MKRNRSTGAGETDSGSSRRFGMNKNKLEDGIGYGFEEVIEGPFQGISTVLTVIDSYDHHLLL